MDLACYYVLDGNAFKKIKREVGCSFRGTAYFYCHLLSISRYILKIADKSVRTADIFEKSLIKFHLPMKLIKKKKRTLHAHLCYITKV